MNENPFIVVGRMKPEYFCDRVEETARLVRCVSSGSNLVLMSPRRVGKTQLIDHCFRQPQLAGQQTLIFIDILKTTTLKEFTYELGKAVFGALASQGQAALKTVLATMRSLTANLGFDAVTGMPTFSLSLGDIHDPAYSLEEIFRTLDAASQRCTIAIDEFQQIRNYPEKHVEALLRTHIQRQRQASFIFAGSERHLLEEMFLDSARPFYNSADIMSLDVIAPDKYADFVRGHFAASGRGIHDDAIAHAYQTFEGNTYYNQKTMREAYARTAPGDVCTQEVVADVIRQMVLDNNRYYSEVLARMSLPQKELLYALAREGRARQVMSGRFVRQHGLGTASSVQSAMRKLLEVGLVSVEAGEYFVADQLMRLWLLQ